MKSPAIRLSDRLGALLNAPKPCVNCDAPKASGLEPLEDRVLLSGAELGGLPTLTHSTYNLASGDYDFYVPHQDNYEVEGVVTGCVFDDVDSDMLWDPDEHAVEYVTVYFDVNNDGKLNEGEVSAETNYSGYFELSGLGVGEHHIRVDMPEGFQRSGWNSDVNVVDLASDRGMGGVCFGIQQSAAKLEAVFSDIRMPDFLKTGKQNTAAIILTNVGNLAYSRKSIVIDIYASSGKLLDSADIKLGSMVLRQALKPGQSVGLDINMDIPDALADFVSYLLISPSITVNVPSAVGGTFSYDYQLPTVATDSPLRFKASDKNASISQNELDIVLSNWVTTTPYGGYAPGYGYDGYVGLDDLDVILNNWNAGRPPRTYNTPSISDISFDHGRFTFDTPTTITATVKQDYTPYVNQVLFFYDTNGDYDLDDLLGMDADGSDGYSITVDVKADRDISYEDRIVAIAVRSDGEHDAHAVYANAAQQVQVSAGKPLQFENMNGQLVTVALAGRGAANISLEIDSGRAYDLGNRIEVRGVASIDDIELVGTAGRSKLKITARGGGASDPLRITGAIHGSTPLGVLDARGCILAGGIEMTGNGVIRRIRANELGDVNMEGDRFSNGVVIEAGEIAGDILLNMPLRLLKAGKVHDADITAPSAGQVIVRGNYKRGQITLTDGEVSESLALLQVGRILANVDVNTASSIDTVRAGTMTDCGILAAGASVFNTPASVLGSSAKRCWIKRLIVNRGAFADSYVAAWRIGQVSLKSVAISDSLEQGGLYYRKLGSYNGPEMVQQTMV